MLTDADAIRRACLDATASDDVRRRDRLDAHVLAGEDVDRRARRAAQAAAAPAHPGERVAAVVADRHGLHEPQPGRARRPRVRLHPDPARRRPQDRRRARRPTPRRGTGRGLDARRRAGGRPPSRCGWPGSATTCATSPSPRATRSRRSCASASRSTPTASTTWSAVVDAVPDADVDALVAEYDDAYDVVARAAPGRGPARVAALRGPQRAGPAGLPRRRRLHRVHHELRGPRRAASAARPRRPAADGRRLRLRRRGRLEDLGAAARAQGDVAGPGRRHLVHGGLHLPPRPGRAEDPRRAHARGLPDDHRPTPQLRDPPARDRRPGGPGPAGVHRRPRPGLSSWASRDLGDRFRLAANEIEIVEPDEPLPRLPVARAVWKPAPDLATSTESWLLAGGPHHTVLSTAVGREALGGLRRASPAPSSSSSTTTTTPQQFAKELRWNQAYYRLARGL